MSWMNLIPNCHKTDIVNAFFIFKLESPYVIGRIYLTECTILWWSYLRPKEGTEHVKKEQDDSFCKEIQCPQEELNQVS